MITHADEIEYPSFSTNDKTAGAPGTSLADDDIEVFGAAHKTIAEEASAPCDMSGNVINPAPGEELVVSPASRSANPSSKIPWINGR